MRLNLSELICAFANPNVPTISDFTTTPLWVMPSCLRAVTSHERKSRFQESEEQVSGVRIQDSGVRSQESESKSIYFPLSVCCLLPTADCLLRLATLRCWTRPTHCMSLRGGGGFRRATSGSRKSREAGANSTSSISNSGKNLASAAIVVG